MNVKKLLISLLVLATLTSCKGDKADKVIEETKERTVGDARIDSSEEGLVFSLESASDQPDDSSGIARNIEGDELSGDDVEALLNRLPDLPKEDGEASFAMREKSLKPPTTGEKITTSFPADGDAAKPTVDETSADFTVRRYAPEGDVELARQVSLTFSTPVVDVTGQTDASETAPATISPAVDGEWKWVGTKTALFVPEDGRFPMASDFEVSTAKGLESANGNALSEDESWSFSTPTVEVERAWPTAGGQDLDPVLMLGFNQKVDDDKLADHLFLRQGNESIPFELVRDAKTIKEEFPDYIVNDFPEDRRVIIRPTAKLSADTGYRYGLDSGAPSAEGLKKTESPQTSSFRTYAPLRVQRHSCGRKRHACAPTQDWWISFNNALDVEAFESSQVTVEPSVDALEAEVAGASLQLSGAFEANTKYVVTLSAELTDMREQKLGSEQDLKFHVGPMPPLLWTGLGNMVVLDPDGDHSIEVSTANIETFRLVVQRVEPKHWSQFQKVQQQYRNDGTLPSLPGETVVDEEVEVDNPGDVLRKTRVSVAEHLEDGHGQFIVALETGDLTRKAEKQRRRYQYQLRPRMSWLQATDLGVDAFVDEDELMAWTTDLRNGDPVDKVDLSILGTNASSRSSKSGLAKLDLPSQPQGNEPSVLVARTDDDLAIIPENTRYWRGRTSWYNARRDDTRYLFHTFDDRGMYRPGETVNIKGWLRTWDVDSEPMLEMPDTGGPSTGNNVEITFHDARGAELGKVEGKLSDTGGFDESFEIPDNANLGYANARITVNGRHQGRHDFEIQEFRTPEFEVSVKAPAGPHMVGDTVPMTTTASYYAGGPLAGSDGTWRVSSSQTSYRPPNFDEFTFGFWTPWWYWGAPANNSSAPESLTFTTDASGQHVVDMKLHDANPALPMSVEASASVSDVSGQTWSSSTNFIVHPSSVYVGLRSSSNFVKKGETFQIDAVAASLDGDAVSDRVIEIEAQRREWKNKDGTWKQVVVETQTCSVESAAKPVTCEFEAKDSGQYLIDATVTDDENRESTSRLYVWVAGEQPRPPKKVEIQDLRMIPGQEEYEVGETATLLLQSPIEAGEGLLTIEQAGITREERFQVEGGSATVEVDVGADDIPNVNVFAEVVGNAPRVDGKGQAVEDAPGRPAIATGQIDLRVKRDTRELDVKVSPESTVVAPGSKTSIEVEVHGPDGEPASNTEVALVVVDEAILALSGYAMPHPLDSFYPSIPSNVGKYHSREWVILQDASRVIEHSEAQRQKKESGVGRGGGGMTGSAMPMAAPAAEADVLAFGGAPVDGELVNPAGTGADQGEAIDLRTDFRPLALFEPALETDAKGRVSVDFEMPDNLTQYRIMAVAAQGPRKFGKGESQLTARLPLMVRPSPPRFLNYGDEMQLRVVVQNPGDQAATVQLASRANNLELDQPAGRAFEVPAGDRVEVRLPAKTHKAGETTVQFAVASGAWGDAAEVTFPVWTPATTEAFATYGTIDKGAISQPVRMPSDVIEEYGALKLSTSSTALQALTDAFIYLVDYPYECSEQTASRIISAVALAPVLDAFDAEGLPDRDKLEAKLQSWVDRLIKLQRSDGGFGLWRYNGNDYPYASVHAIHALYRAEQFGLEVPARSLSLGQNYLARIENHIPAFYSEKSRNTIKAYAYYASDLGGKTQDHVRKAVSLAKKKPGDELGLEAIGWIISTLADEQRGKSTRRKLERYLMNRVSETASTAQFTTDYGDQGYVIMYSSRRVDAVLLESLIRHAPKHDLIPKLARGLLDHRKRGRWSNTQENVFVLLALKEYFDAYENQTPDFVARAWLGNEYAAEHTYKGRSTETKMVDIPLTYIDEQAGDDDRTDLVLQKDGKGRLYYRIGMTYAPASLELEPAEYGFAVEREYEAVDDPSEVQQLDDGSWQIKLGARVRVRLRMVAPARRYHVALVDKMPGGFETLNPALAVTEPIPADDKPSSSSGDGHYWWWWRPWYEHQNMRTERTEAFASLVWPGVHEYSYVARATTPGTFVVPPAKAEEMYHPETFGRTGTTRVVISD